MACKLCDPKSKYSKCICDSSWKSYNDTLNKIQSLQYKFLDNKLRISTITLCFEINSKINISKLCEDFPPQPASGFYNSILYNWNTKYQTKKIVSVKIFPNGKFQIAGLVSIESCAYIMRKIYNKIYPYINNKETSKIINPKIVMINSGFKINFLIDLIKLCKILSNINIENKSSINEGAFISITYQPIKYPAINTKYLTSHYIEDYYNHKYNHGLKKKYKKNISILIFRSGSIIITGGNNIEDYFKTYEHFLNIINLNLKKIKIN